MSKLFPEKSQSNPTIYAYRTPGAKENEGLLKVGYTVKNVRDRIDQQLKTGGINYEIVLEESAMREDGSTFVDHAVHKQLKADGFINEQLEWFRCDVEDVRSAIIAVRDRLQTSRDRTWNFKMRPEQKAAVNKAAEHFRSFKANEPTKTPHFLWNAKMRFGKTFAAYQLALEMGWKKILVLTFKSSNFLFEASG